MALATAQTLPLRGVHTDEPDPYLEVARRFFNEFLELKVDLDRQGAVTQEVQKKERARFDKEMAKWKDANELLKSRAQAFANDNERLEAELAEVMAERDDLRRQVNEHLMRNNETARRLHEYPLDQNMSDRAFAEWQDIIKMMSSAPTARG